jgi:PleD family two-component response regulator
MVCCTDINDLSTKASRGCYNKSKRTFDSFDPKRYDEIITKVNLQTREKYKHNTMQQGEGLLDNQPTNKKKVLVIDDEPDICMVYQMVLEDAGYGCISYTMVL